VTTERKKAAEPWSTKVADQFGHTVDISFKALAESVRRDRSPTNQARFLTEFENLNAFEKFARTGCVPSGPDKLFKPVEGSDSFFCREVGPWKGYCRLQAPEPVIEWMAAIHGDFLYMLSLTILKDRP
jgi:hypothetical protein